MKQAKRMHLGKLIAIFFIMAGIFGLSQACRSSEEVTDIPAQIVKFSPEEGAFSLVTEAGVASLVADSIDLPGVMHAVQNLREDIQAVSGQLPKLRLNEKPGSGPAVIIGTIGSSSLINALVDEGKLDVSSVKDEWEAYLITQVEGTGESMLVIAGSDMRGTIYGIYELSRQMGISPWYWWADVPVKKNEELYIAPGTHTDHPLVKYRGIFLNDEAPALTGWAIENFGGFNHQFYSHVFELILRLKGNFLWPAMWGSAFYDDDKLNPVIANEMGVVIGTSHHEPLMRAHDEWRRYGEGDWNYETNPENLKKFWSESIKERKDYEALMTVGMRGDGDRAMAEGTVVALLEKIIHDQREILQKETGKEAAEIPQVWALYKEVQDYYNKGMEVPEDITLLLCDDNWGNVRVLPKPGTPERAGSYGMYYHFDFVGGPVSYRWLNVSPVSRTWEQMNLSWEHGVDRIWIVNVGDLKPMEFPVSFFLDHAWNPDRMTAEAMGEYTVDWASEQFGPEPAEEIAELLTGYSRFNYRRTPEMLSPETYSLHNFREAETVVQEYNALLVKAKAIAAQLPEEYQDAFYQLVTHPIEACSNLNAMYVTAAKNRLYAAQGRASTNQMAEKVDSFFENDKKIEDYYHHELAGGKWNHFMSQTHIGYTSWNNPPENYMPKVEKIKVPAKASMGLMVEGSSEWWPNSGSVAELPVFDNLNQQEYYIELFNRGKEKLKFSIQAADPWVIVNKVDGTLGSDTRIYVGIDWENIPDQRRSSSLITVIPNIGEEMQIELAIKKLSDFDLGDFTGFVEANGYVAMEAEDFTAKQEVPGMEWMFIPEFGRTKSGIAISPTTHPPVEPGGKNPCLEYNVFITSPGEVEVKVHIAPTLNIYNDDGMQFATAFDEDDPVSCRIHEFDTIPDWFYPEYWNVSVTDNTRILSTRHKVEESGAHTLKLWMVTPGVVFERIVIETKDIGYTYLGPPRSYFR